MNMTSIPNNNRNEMKKQIFLQESLKQCFFKHKHIPKHIIKNNEKMISITQLTKIGIMSLTISKYYPFFIAVVTLVSEMKNGVLLYSRS